MLTTATYSPALNVLRDVFGYPAFRGAQAEIIDHIGRGGDALVLMPTGGTFYYVNISVDHDFLDTTRPNQRFGQPIDSGTNSYFSWHQRSLEFAQYPFLQNKTVADFILMPNKTKLARQSAIHNECSNFRVSP